MGGVEAGIEPLDKLPGFSGRVETYPPVVHADPPAVLFGVVLEVDVHGFLRSMHGQENCGTMQTKASLHPVREGQGVIATLSTNTAAFMRAMARLRGWKLLLI